MGMEATQDFFQRPWFRRIWAIQECALARRPVFHLGRWEKEWNYIGTVEKTIRDKGLGVLDSTQTADAEKAAELRQGLIQLQGIVIMRKRLAEEMKCQLMDLASMFQTSRTTDLRDHLFALLNLTSNVNDGKLDPRYEVTDTIAKVCLDYARFILQTRGDLDVLYRAGLQGQRMFAPSWAPDWYGGHDGLGFESPRGCWDPLNRPSVCNIAEGTCPRIIQTFDPGVLGLRGTQIGTPKELANAHLNLAGPRLDDDFLFAQSRRHIQESDEIMSKLEKYPTGEKSSDVRWRALIRNLMATCEKAPKSYRACYKAFRKYMPLEKKMASPKDYDRKEPFHRVVEDYNSDKIFGLTVSGYVGMFPRAAQSGDIVVVLDGGEFPFVLRKLMD